MRFKRSYSETEIKLGHYPFPWNFASAGLNFHVKKSTCESIAGESAVRISAQLSEFQAFSNYCSSIQLISEI